MPIISLQPDMRTFFGSFLVLTFVTSTGLAAQDTLRIRSTAAPRWGPSVKLTMVQSIGQADGPDEYSFGSLGGFAFDRTGRVYAYDTQDKKLRAYDARGKFLHNIGGFGAGPGEFAEVSNILITDDTVVVVRDAENSRVSYFYPNGKLRGSFNHPALGRTVWSSFTIDREGLVTFSTRRNDPALAKDATGIDRLRYNQLVRVRANGTAVDSMNVPTGLPYDDSKMFTIAAWGGGNNFIPESRHAALRSGGFVAGDGNALRFMIRPPTGPVRIVERAWKPVPLGREERANWTEFADMLMKRPYKGVGGTGKPRDYTVPSVKPAFNSIVTDDDSRVWISVYAPAHKVELPPRTGTAAGPRLWWRQNDVYEVFTDKGDYLGRVALPDQVFLVKAQGNRIWTRTTGPDDEEIIRVYSMSTK